MLTIPNHFLGLNMFGNSFQDYLFHHFPHYQDDGDQAEVLGPSFLKIGVAFGFFQSSGTSPACHDLSKTTKSNLTKTSASSLSTHGRNPSGPMCQKRMQNCHSLMKTWLSSGRHLQGKTAFKWETTHENPVWRRNFVLHMVVLSSGWGSSHYSPQQYPCTKT